jgi:hypothetical protein
MNRKTINSIILLSFYLINLTTVFAQRCGPNPRIVDRQILSSNGDIILLRTEFNGGLMDVFNNQKNFDLNYVLISENGKVQKDTSLNLKWDEKYYDFMSCSAIYRQKNKPDYPCSNENECALYFPFSHNNTTVLEYYLCGDRKFAYEITINKKGDGKSTLYNLDTIGLINVVKYHDDFTKYGFFKNYLEKKYDKLDYLPSEQFEFLNEKTKVKITNRNIELYKDSSSYKWKIKGEKWEISLDGSIFSYHNNPPLINIQDKVLYVTVFNEDFASCPGYGQDTFPITYAINIKKRKIIWKQEIKYKN